MGICAITRNASECGALGDATTASAGGATWATLSVDRPT